MAANWKGSQGILTLGKRAVNQIWIANSLYLRRAAHTSLYDENVNDHVRPSNVPEDVIQQASDKYWAPHPQTGVFGPASALNPVVGTGSAPASSDPVVGTGSEPASSDQNSVLEEKAWFRPTSLEDLEKPPHHH